MLRDRFPGLPDPLAPFKIARFLLRNTRKGLRDAQESVHDLAEEFRGEPPAEPRAQKVRKPTTKAARVTYPPDVSFALAVAEEYGDPKVKGWAQELADGKISEKQWVSRLTSHAAATRKNLDDVMTRVEQRIAGET